MARPNYKTPISVYDSIILSYQTLKHWVGFSTAFSTGFIFLSFTHSNISPFAFSLRFFTRSALGWIWVVFFFFLQSRDISQCMSKIIFLCAISTLFTHELINKIQFQNESSTIYLRAVGFGLRVWVVVLFSPRVCALHCRIVCHRGPLLASSVQIFLRVLSVEMNSIA